MEENIPEKSDSEEKKELMEKLPEKIPTQKIIDEENSFAWIAYLGTLQTKNVQKRRRLNSNQQNLPDPLSLPPYIFNWKPVQLLCSEISNLATKLEEKPDGDLKNELFASFEKLTKQIVDVEPLYQEMMKIKNERENPKVKPKKVRVGAVCQKCGKSESPEWRRGPDSQLYCNACGLRYKKELKRKFSSQDQ